MGTSRRQALLGVLSASLLPAQRGADVSGRPSDTNVPDIKIPAEAILKADYEQNVKDARELTTLAKSIELDFDKNDQNVLSLSLLKKLDDVEKITKRIRGRIKK